jgi:hypothetical protein
MGSVRSPQHSSGKHAVGKLVELVRVMGHEPATPAERQFWEFVENRPEPYYKPGQRPENRPITLPNDGELIPAQVERQRDPDWKRRPLWIFRT